MRGAFGRCLVGFAPFAVSSMQWLQRLLPSASHTAAPLPAVPKEPFLLRACPGVNPALQCMGMSRNFTTGAGIWCALVCLGLGMPCLLHFVLRCWTDLMLAWVC